MKNIFLFLLLNLSLNICFSQNKTVVDSLEQLLIFSKEDTSKVNLLNDLSWELRKQDPVKALDHAHNALALSIKLRWEKGKAISFSRIGIINFWQNKYDIAREYHLKALQINKSQELKNKNAVNETLNVPLMEIRGNKTSIGGITADDYSFVNHEIELRTGDCFYIFTDGYVDQFGGERSKKFKTSRLKELLLAIHQIPMKEQKTILENTIESWQGPLEQVDDICIIGARV